MLHHRLPWSRKSEIRNELTSAYELLQPFVLMEFAKQFEDAIFLDIGANIGFYGITFAKLENISSVLMFEPNQHCLNEIHKNLRLNELTQKVQVHPIALSFEKGKANFSFTSDLGGDGGISSTHLFRKAIRSESEVCIDILDNLFSHRNKAIVIKLDVEGHELQVLKGSVTTLRENHGIVQLEMLPANPDREEIVQCLENLGWTRILRVGSDYYFSNLETLKVGATVLATLECAFESIIRECLSPGRPSRRMVARGVTIEISRRYIDTVKSLLNLPSRIFKK
jgi:FkbM family methyltransferase